MASSSKMAAPRAESRVEIELDDLRPDGRQLEAQVDNPVDNQVDKQVRRQNRKKARNRRRNPDEYREDSEIGGENVPRVARDYVGTSEDEKDMKVFGRTQQLKRVFGFLSVFSMSSNLISTWTIVLVNMNNPLQNGGTAGMLWGFIVVFVGLSFGYASIGEMSSMAATCGGQYHWVSEFAPKKCGTFLSYMVGWLSFTSWQAGIASSVFLPAEVIRDVIRFNNPDWDPQGWHTTLLAIGVAAIALLFNTKLSGVFGHVQCVMLTFYIVGALAFVLLLFCGATRGGHHEVWTDFNNGGGWNSVGTSTLVGMLNPTVTLLGYDCTVHMGEEVKDAKRIVPRAMMYSYFFNGTIGLVMAIALAYAVKGTGLKLDPSAGSPIIQLVYHITKSHAATNAMMSIMIIVQIGGAMAELATASRQLWAFARDGGMPGHEWISFVAEKVALPNRAIYLSAGISVLITLVNIGSGAAIGAFFALTGVSFLTSYTIAIGCVLYKRLRGHPMPGSAFDLRMFGPLLNALGLCFLLPTLVFAFFPAMDPTTAEEMNWAIVIFVAVLIFAVIWWFINGREDYYAPSKRIYRDLVE